MSFHQCTEMFVQLNVLCLGNWPHAPLRKKCGEVLVFSIFHPTRLFRPTQLLIWMNLPPYTIIPHCTAIRHFKVMRSKRRLHTKFKKTQCPKVLDKYKEMRHTLQREIRKSYWAYISPNKNSCDRLFSAMLRRIGVKTTAGSQQG